MGGIERLVSKILFFLAVLCMAKGGDAVEKSEKLISVASLSSSESPSSPATFFSGKADTGGPSFFLTADHQKIRFGHWKPISDRSHPVTILLLQGRASFIEKNLDFIQDLQRKGYDVWTFDWRGQGGSSRPIGHPQKNHIDSFETYLSDLHHFIQKYVHPQSSGPIFLLGESMGGHLALRYLHDFPSSSLQGVILMSPMIRMKTDPFPWILAKLWVKSACAFGFCEDYAIGYGDYDPKKGVFEKNKMTQDPVRYQKTQQLCLDRMDLVCGGPTYGWVEAAFKSVAILESESYLSEITLPIFMAIAGQDMVVDNQANTKLCEKLKGCTFKTYPNSLHNISKEKEPIRTDFLKDIDHFIQKTLKQEALKQAS